jgi:Na+/H+ antiporter NhaD/arsenite permease-like protein
MKTIAIIIFVLTYVLLMFLPKYRAYIAVAAATIFVIIGVMPVGHIFGTINWNVIMMIAGTMGVVALFIESKMPSRMADIMIERLPNVKWAILALSMFAGIISAFVDNVATVLMVAPIALTISKKLNISPVKSVIAIAIASNLQGAATLVGDTTSILLGGYANMDFLDFFYYQGKPGMFFVVQISAIVATGVLYWMFRNESQPISGIDRTEVKDYFPSVLLLGMVLMLILASFLPADGKPAVTNGIICTSMFAIGMARNLWKYREKGAFQRYMKEVDYFTIILLAGLFVVIGALTEVGVVQDIANIFVSISGDNIFVIYSLILWFSVVLSAFIDNIPYIATMLPVTASIAVILGVDPTVLYFGLLSGATLGGNLTPIGASANIAGLGILRRAGYEVTPAEFMKISVPFTLAAVLVGYGLVWFLWG